MASFSKFTRPEAPRRGTTSAQDLDCVETVLRYRFSPTSELVRLVGGNEDVTLRRLRRLWEHGIINRFAFPFPRPHSEFVYYLDNRQTLDLLIQHSRLDQIHQQMEDEVRLNRRVCRGGAIHRHPRKALLVRNVRASRLCGCGSS